MVKVQYTLSRSKGQAGELGSSLGERPVIAQPALQRRNLCRMGIQHPACIFIKHCICITNYWIFWYPNWFLAIASIMAQFWQASYHIQRSLKDMCMKYIFISHVAAYGGIADQTEWGVKLQECFPLTKWDVYQSVRLCSYWKIKGCFEVLINAAFVWHHRW